MPGDFSLPHQGTIYFTTKEINILNYLESLLEKHLPMYTAEESCAWFACVSQVNLQMCILCLWFNLAGHMFGERHCFHGGLNLNESESLSNKGKQMHKSYKSKVSPVFFQLRM